MIGGKALPKLVVVGAGGHAKVVVEAVRAEGRFDLVGLVDPSPAAPRLLGLPVLGGEDLLPRLLSDGVTSAVIALGGNALRQRVGAKLKKLGFALPAVTHPTALVSPSACVGEGAVIMACAVVGTEAVVSELAIINTAANIDHDNQVGIAAHIAPGCALAGNVSVGDRTLIGVGSAVRPGVRIGADVTVGAGSSVVADVASGVTVVGVPARILAGRGGE